MRSIWSRFLRVTRARVKNARKLSMRLRGWVLAWLRLLRGGRKEKTWTWKNRNHNCRVGIVLKAALMRKLQSLCHIKRSLRCRKKCRKKSRVIWKRIPTIMKSTQHRNQVSALIMGMSVSRRWMMLFRISAAVLMDGDTKRCAKSTTFAAN